MKKTPDHDLLLDAVLSEGMPLTGDILLGHTLLLARRRRLFRQARIVVAGAALLAVGLFLIRSPSAHEVVVPPVSKLSYTPVRTRLLPPSDIVVTLPLAENWFVATSGTTRSIRSTPLNYGVLTDGELLTLIAPRGGALVRSKSGFEHLVFVNPKDANGFPLN